MTRVSVFTKYLNPIGDIRTNPVYEFILNADPNPGRCEFTMSQSDPKCSPKYLEFGNVVLIRRANLPDWLGVIVRRSWGFGKVDILCLQIEYILEKRNTPIKKFTGVAGNLFNQVLNITNAVPFNEKQITAYSIFVGGTNREETFGNSALSHIRAIAARSGNDFSIGYGFDTNGKMYLLANWYERRGEITNKFLREGFNIRLTNNVLIEDARELGNWVEGRGDASTDGTRPSVVNYNETSIKQYGLNQISKVFDGNKEPATIGSNTLSVLRSTLDPAQSFDITALDVTDTFNFLGIGNVHEIDLNTAGFGPDGSFGNNTLVETLAMEVNSLENTCRLIVQEYTPDIL